LKQCGVVVENKMTTAKVLIQRHSSCGSCKGCRLGNEDFELEVEAINQVEAKVGQRVEVVMDEESLLQAAFIAYTIPLIALLSGIILGGKLLTYFDIVDYHEIFTAMIGFTLMGLTFLIIRKREKIIKTKKKFMPVITAITNDIEKI